MTDALSLALKGDDVFFKAIEEADQDTFGTSCLNCDTYHIGRVSINRFDARCPVCGSGRGWMESPALGHGPRSIQHPEGELDGGEPVVAALIYG